MITIAGLPALPTRRNLLHKNLLSSKNQQKRQGMMAHTYLQCQQKVPVLSDNF